MHSKLFIFFALIASAHCLLSDDINQIFTEKCNQSIDQLTPLKLKLSCAVAPSSDLAPGLMCNITENIISDICIKKLAQFSDVIASVKPINPEVFCKNLSNVSTKVPDSISKFFADAGNCKSFCTFVSGKLNPICQFIVGYYRLQSNESTLKLPQASHDIKKNASSDLGQQQPSDLNLHAKEGEEMGKNDAAIKPSPEPPKKSPIVKNDQPSVQTIVKTSNANNSNPETVPDNLPNDGEISELQPDGKQNAEESVNANPPELSLPDIDLQKSENPLAEKGPNDPVEFSENRDAEVEKTEPKITQPAIPQDLFIESQNSHFFAFFVFMSALCIFFYVAMYNKKKILALLIEGRRSSSKRRPNSAAYSKLTCNLEEAMTSAPSTSSSNTLLY